MGDATQETPTEEVGKQETPVTETNATTTQVAEEVPASEIFTQTEETDLADAEMSKQDTAEADGIEMAASTSEVDAILENTEAVAEANTEENSANAADATNPEPVPAA